MYNCVTFVFEFRTAEMAVKLMGLFFKELENSLLLEFNFCPFAIFLDLYGPREPQGNIQLLIDHTQLSCTAVDMTECLPLQVVTEYYQFRIQYTSHGAQMDFERYDSSETVGQDYTTMRNEHSSIFYQFQQKQCQDVKPAMWQHEKGEHPAGEEALRYDAEPGSSARQRLPQNEAGLL